RSSKLSYTPWCCTAWIRHDSNVRQPSVQKRCSTRLSYGPVFPADVGSGAVSDESVERHRLPGAVHASHEVVTNLPPLLRHPLDGAGAELTGSEQHDVGGLPFGRRTGWLLVGDEGVHAVAVE